MENDKEEVPGKINRWRWFDGKICLVQFMNSALICNANHDLVSNGDGELAVTALRGMVTVDGASVRIEAALDANAPESVWTFGVHEGDISSMVFVEKKLVTRP